MALPAVPKTLQAVFSQTAAYRYLVALVSALSSAEAAQLQKKTITVGFADLAGGTVNGAAVSVNLSTALPANARPVGHAALKLTTPFTGGSASAVTLDIGTAGDPTSIVVGADVLSAAVDGQASTNPSGKAPGRHYATSTQLLARFTPDAGHKLQNLTAGSITIDVLYAVMA